jgi:hypothetical protein
VITLEAKTLLRKNRLLSEIRKGLKEVKMIREEKALSYSMYDLFAKK